MSDLLSNAKDAMELWQALFPERLDVPLSQFVYWIARNEAAATTDGITSAMNKARKEPTIPTKNLLAYASRCMISYKQEHEISIISKNKKVYRTQEAAQ
jgi:hypothetical protein